jgi:uncharacterized protein YecE (DUF72 family)
MLAPMKIDFVLKMPKQVTHREALHITVVQTQRVTEPFTKKTSWAGAQKLQEDCSMRHNSIASDYLVFLFKLIEHFKRQEIGKIQASNI